MSHVDSLRCFDCGATYPANEYRSRCKACQGYLGLTYHMDGVKQAAGRTDFRANGEGSPLLRWLPFLPIEHPALIEAVSLGERETPLLRCDRLGADIGLTHLWIKNESAFPTGSLKDRSMPLVVLKALEFGYGTVSIVSSGNAAASLAAYAARAGLRAVVFVRAEASPAKLAKMAPYNPVIVRVQSHLADIGRLFAEVVEESGWFDCDGMVNPFRCEGKKTCTFEIALQLGWQAPDWVLIPTSTGNGMVAAHIGFKDLVTAGLIDRMPRLVGVQLEACPPIAQAFASGSVRVNPIIPGASVSDTLLNGNPEAGPMVLRAARETGGMVVTVSDAEMLHAQRMLASSTGIFAEPAGAVTVAAAANLRKADVLKAGERVVCLATGHGLNQPDVIATTLGLPEAVPASVAAIREFLARHPAGDRKEG